jgi:hypothetical protein
MIECPAVVDVPKTNLRPEAELLLCCARTRLDAPVSERLRNLAQLDIDWKALLQTARCHGLLALLYRNLAATAPDLMPQAVLDEYREQYRIAAWCNLFLTTQLVQILRRLEETGIRVVPLKGPVLAATLYGDLTLRDFGDLDILIPPEQAWQARDVLIAAGYRPHAPATPIHAAIDFRSPREHHFALTSLDGRVIVEVHWRLAQPCYAFPLDSDRLWRCLVRVPLATTTVAGFPPEELLLILCQHGAKHAWNQLKFICDVAELLRAQLDLNWDRFRQRVRTIGCERMVDVGLLLAQKLLGADLSGETSNGTRTDPMVQALVREVCERLFRRDPDGSDPEDKWLFYLRARERWRDRVQVCRGLGAIPNGTDWTVFPLRARCCYYLAKAVLPGQRDREVVKLPAAFSVVYVIIRPVRLVGKYLRRLARAGLGFLAARL